MARPSAPTRKRAVTLQPVSRSRAGALAVLSILLLVVGVIGALVIEPKKSTNVSQAPGTTTTATATTIASPPSRSTPTTVKAAATSTTAVAPATTATTAAVAAPAPSTTTAAAPTTSTTAKATTTTTAKASGSGLQQSGTGQVASRKNSHLAVTGALPYVIPGALLFGLALGGFSLVRKATPDHPVR